VVVDGRMSGSTRVALLPLRRQPGVAGFARGPRSIILY
jgi:hypothetical protein